MDLKKGEIIILLFNAVYVLAFAAYYVSIRNFEFLWYVAVLLFFGILIASTLRKTNFDYVILWGLSFWGFLHMAGGGIRIGGKVLYGMELIPLWVTKNFYVLRFDQFVHAFGFGVTALVAWHLLKDHWKDANTTLAYSATVAISMGLGALNEIVEFIAVLAFPETGVGGYYNTAFDLVFNLIGAVIAVIYIHLRRR